MNLLTVNCGSSSIRVKVFDIASRDVLASGLLEGLGGAESRWHLRRRRADAGFDAIERTAAAADHREGLAMILDPAAPDAIVGQAAAIAGVAHRVVHGGARFSAPARITDEVIEAIRDLDSLAPLHNPFNLLGIEMTRERFPGVPQVAIFDTAFHQDLPPRAFEYALPADVRTAHRIRRYGFHGISNAYVARAAARHLGRPLESVNLVVLHLGNGASATAVAGGRSADTSMGMTPLEGLVMGSRCGDLDPSIPGYLVREAGASPDEVEETLRSRSGLVGLCGTNDMREIQRRAAAGDADAGLALDVYCYRIRKYVGAYAVVLGTIDALVFTGGVGENSAPVRERVCAGLGGLGIRLGPARRFAAGLCELQAEGSAVRVLVVPTDEELEMAGQAIDVLAARAPVRTDADELPRSRT